MLDVGRARRTIPGPIRKALIQRDKGCAFPGCDRRPRQCHGHHAVHWADGGVTALDNLVLLCGEHHRVVHHGNWGVRIEDNVPVFDDLLKASCARPRPGAGNAA
ncbi:HNH endonuclease signature motif containing protein [Kutzneria chonburiensis]|uniref:HNH endonuclease signature motif containing protein n=1 Tax=Kutzneria chonburiensis TaxID=1483604 RepID=UPI003B63D274